MNTALTSKWLRIRGHYPQHSLIDLSVKKLTSYLEFPHSDSRRLQENLLKYYLLEAMIVRNANKLVDPTLFFPFSLSSLEQDLTHQLKLGSQIILVNHIAGFTLLINLVTVIALKSTDQDIVILYRMVNIDLIKKIRSNWIQSPRLYFILVDRSGLISLKIHLQNGALLIALTDIPQEEMAQGCQPIRFLHDQLFFKTGILRLAATFNRPILPIVHYLASYRLVYRFCPIVRVSKADLRSPDKQKQILESLFLPLTEILSQYPEQWFLWHKIPTKSMYPSSVTFRNS